MLLILLVFEVVFLSLVIFFLISDLISFSKGVPYVPLPKKSIRKILKFAEIKESDNFCDLGSSDGRVLIEAAKNSGIKKAIGYEILPWPYLKAKFLISRLGFKEKIKILQKDFFRADLTEAKTVFIYLFPKIVQKLVLKFSRELKSGTKVISVSFPIESPEKFNLKLIKSGKDDRFGAFIYEKV